MVKITHDETQNEVALEAEQKEETKPSINSLLILLDDLKEKRRNELLHVVSEYDKLLTLSDYVNSVWTANADLYIANADDRLLRDSHLKLSNQMLVLFMELIDKQLNELTLIIDRIPIDIYELENEIKQIVKQMKAEQEDANTDSKQTDQHI